jgi:hypothetical protein
MLSCEIVIVDLQIERSIIDCLTGNLSDSGALQNGIPEYFELQIDGKR